MNVEEFRAAGYAAIDRVCDHLAGASPLRPVSSTLPGDIVRQLPQKAPVGGEPWSDIERDFREVIEPGLVHWNSPQFMAYFASSLSYECVLGDIYSAAMSSPNFSWVCSPAATELETVVMDWLAKMMGLDTSFQHAGKTGGGGVMMTGASEAALTMVVAARERAIAIWRQVHPGADPRASHLAPKLVLYATSQTHSLAPKAAQVLGLRFRALQVHAEDGFGLRGDTLRAALEEDTERGLIPFILVLTVGTTATGAVDNVGECTAVAVDYPFLAIHVDAAWGGNFNCLPELRDELQLPAINAVPEPRVLNGFHQARTDRMDDGAVHSFCLNLGKGPHITIDASCLFVRQRHLLTDALEVTPSYLRNQHSEEGTVLDLHTHQLGLTRRFRSLKVWFTLRSHGISGFQQAQRHLIGLASLLEARVLADPAGPLRLFVPRRLSLVVLRLQSPHQHINADLNELNRRWYGRLCQRDDLQLTSSIVEGSFVVRVAMVSPHTQPEHVDNVYRILLAAARCTLAASVVSLTPLQ